MSYKNILLIDDDSDDAEIFLEAVQELKKNISCNVLSSALEAYDQLINQRLHPDIIFLDHNMPVMGGEKFLAKIKSNDELRYIPVFILSTSSNPSAIDRIKQMGAIDFIIKPNSFKGLVRVLESVLC